MSYQTMFQSNQVIFIKEIGLLIFLSHISIYLEHSYINKRLYEFMELLNNSFVQVSKGSIVNIDYVNSVEVSFSGSLKIIMKNDLVDYISRSYVKSFKNKIGM